LFNDDEQGRGTDNERDKEIDDDLVVSSCQQFQPGLGLNDGIDSTVVNDGQG
jgi:hypothetical protein